MPPHSIIGNVAAQALYECELTFISNPAGSIFNSVSYCMNKEGLALQSDILLNILQLQRSARYSVLLSNGLACDSVSSLCVLKLGMMLLMQSNERTDVFFFERKASN